MRLKANSMEHKLKLRTNTRREDKSMKTLMEQAKEHYTYGSVNEATSLSILSGCVMILNGTLRRPIGESFGSIMLDAFKCSTLNMPTITSTCRAATFLWRSPSHSMRRNTMIHSTTSIERSLWSYQPTAFMRRRWNVPFMLDRLTETSEQNHLNTLTPRRS